MPPIDTAGPNWEAFATLMGAAATLLTGLAAVGAATFVGLRQVKIAARQLTINAAQVDLIREQAALQKTTLRHELFERRSRVYGYTHEFMRQFFPDNDKAEFAEEIGNDFWEGKRIAVFLFSRKVVAGLEEIADRARDLGSVRYSIATLDPELEEAREQLLNDEKRHMGWMKRAWLNLPELFEEMNLGEELDPEDIPLDHVQVRTVPPYPFKI